MTTTPTTERSTMIAVFANRDQANQAIDNLRRAGYGYASIRLVERGGNSFVENLKSLFTGQTTASTNSPDDWMRVGVPEQDARNYQQEIDAGMWQVVLPTQADVESQAGSYAPGVLSEQENAGFTKSGIVTISREVTAKGARQPE